MKYFIKKHSPWPAQKHSVSVNEFISPTWKPSTDSGPPPAGQTPALLLSWGPQGRGQAVFCRWQCSSVGAAAAGEGTGMLVDAGTSFQFSSSCVGCGAWFPRPMDNAVQSGQLRRASLF